MTTEEKISVLPKTSVIQTIFRLLLGGVLIYTGIGHLTWMRIEFQAQVPHWVPLNKDLVVLLSGVVEIMLGLALMLMSKYRFEVGWVVAIFFVLVFPGNIAQYLNGIDAFGLNTNCKRAIRLLFQPILIIWALWATAAWHNWRRNRVL